MTYYRYKFTYPNHASTWLGNRETDRLAAYSQAYLVCNRGRGTHNGQEITSIVVKKFEEEEPQPEPEVVDEFEDFDEFGIYRG